MGKRKTKNEYAPEVNEAWRPGAGPHADKRTRREQDQLRRQIEDELETYEDYPRQADSTN